MNSPGWLAALNWVNLRSAQYLTRPKIRLTFGLIVKTILANGTYFCGRLKYSEIFPQSIISWRWFLLLTHKRTKISFAYLEKPHISAKLRQRTIWHLDMINCCEDYATLSSWNLPKFGFFLIACTTTFLSLVLKAQAKFILQISFEIEKWKHKLSVKSSKSTEKKHFVTK